MASQGQWSDTEVVLRRVGPGGQILEITGDGNRITLDYMQYGATHNGSTLITFADIAASEARQHLQVDSDLPIPVEVVAGLLDDWRNRNT